MASRTEKFAYRVELDGKSAADALDILGKKSKDLREQMKKMKEANDLAGFEKVERELRSVEREAKRYQQAMFDVQKVMNNLSGVTTRDLITTQRILSKQLKDELIPGTKEHTEALKKLGDVQKQIISNNAAIRNAGKEEGKGGSMFGKLAEGVNKYALVVGSAIFGISSLVSKTSEAVDAFNKFEQAKAELQSLTGVSMEAREEMGKFAMELSTSTVEGGVRITKSAVDIVDAFKLVGSQAPELLKDSVALQQVTKDALILAEAAGGDVRENVKGLTTTMNMFDLVSSDTNKTIAESHRIINILAAGAQAGAGEIPYIQEAMEKAGTQAHMFGISVENTVGIIETLAPRISEASIAGTGLRGVLLDLEKQTNNNFKPSVVGYTQAMNNLAAANLSTAQLVKLVGVEQATALTLLINHRDETVAYTEAVTNSNKAIEQASINTDTNNAKIAQATNAAEKESIALGEKLAPALLAVSIGRAKVLGFLNSFIDSIGLGTSEAQRFADAFNEQRGAVETLEKNMLPLLDRIDELKLKSSLSQNEQRELSNAITKVGEALPIATTNVNSFGAALDVNTAKARQFIQDQRDMLMVINSSEIIAREEELADLLKKQFDLGAKIAYQKVNAQRTGQQFEANATLLQLNSELAKVNSAINGTQKRLEQLKGDNLKVSENIAGTGNKDGKIGSSSSDNAEKAEKDAAKALKELESAKDRIRELNAQIQTSLKEGIDKEVFSIYQKYQKEIDVAAKNEKEKTDLSKDWGKVRQELELAREEETKNAILKFEKEKEDAQQKSLDKEAERRKQLHDQALAILDDAHTQELAKYKKLLDDKVISEEEYLRIIEKVNENYAAKQDKSRKRWKDKEDKEKEDSIKRAIHAEMQINSALSDLVQVNMQQELQAAGENEFKKKEIKKKYADTEFKITTARIIAATALAIIEAFPNPLLMGAAAITGGLQEAVAIKQRNLVQGYEHGYYNVTRTDGMQYRAGISNDTSTQTVSKPTVFLAGEGGFPEMIIDGHTMRNLQINYPEAINAIHASRTMPGFANGSYATNTVVNNNTVKEVINAELVAVLQDFKAMMAQGIKANLVWRDLKEFEKKVDSLKTDFN